MSRSLAEVDVLLSQYLHGDIDASDLHRRLEAWLDDEPGFLGPAGDPIGEIIALLHLEPAEDAAEVAALRDKIAVQGRELRKLVDQPVLQATTATDAARYLDDDDPRVRAWAAVVAATLGADVTLDDRLRTALQDVDDGVARSAALALAQRGTVHALADILAGFEANMTRPYRQEFWAAAELARKAGPLEREAVAVALDRYVERGGAAAAQARELISSLRSEG